MAREIPVHLVKDAGIDQEDGEILGAYTWDMPGQPTMHGRSTKWDLAVASGNVLRTGSKPLGSRGPGRRPR